MRGRQRALTNILLCAVVTLAGTGCATGGDTSGNTYTPGGGGSAGAEEAGTDASGGSGGTGGSGGSSATGGSGGVGGTSTGGTGGTATDAGADASDDAASDSAADGPSETSTDGSNLKPVGAPCTDKSECSSGFCEDVGQSAAPQKACIRPCLPNIDCPDGTRCTTVPPLGAICAPYHDEACGLCTTDADCVIQGNHCLSGAGGQKFCGVDCSYDGACPDGMECQNVSGNQLCAPQGGAACPCAPNRSGETRACENNVGGVVCVGVETCDGAQAAFVGCTALTPSIEVCNGIDDDCNGTIDDLPHATCDCSGGSCSLVCAAGWAHYPPSVPESDGCTCVADAFEGADGGACATPHPVDAVVDVGGTASRTITGTLSSDADEDWFTVTFTDTAESAANSFHAAIAFTSNPNDEFRFVVVPDCSTAPSAPKLTTADSCYNFLAGGIGLTPCGEVTGQNHCATVTMTRTIGVMRNPNSVSKTCSSYEITINAAAGTCDPATFDSCTW